MYRLLACLPACLLAHLLACRASGLVLPGLAVTRLPEFKSIAVSAHLWLPLIEVPGATPGRSWRLPSQTGHAMRLPQAAACASLPRRTLRWPAEAMLAAWLQRQAAQGWTLVGLEQSTESVQLQVEAAQLSWK